MQLCNKDQDMLLLTLLFMFLWVEAQGTPAEAGYKYASDSVEHLSIVILICFFILMFFIIFLLFIHPRLCPNLLSHPQQHQNLQLNEPIPVNVSFAIPGRLGMDKSLINLLPSFTFSSLTGSKEGLQCAVCLSTFLDTEVLRALPKCKHAFHLNCIDQWLENHQSCPLCRQKVDAEDVGVPKSSSSLIFPQTLSELSEEKNVQYFIHRQEDDTEPSRFCVGSSFRKTEGDKVEGSTSQEGEHGKRVNQKAYA